MPHALLQTKLHVPAPRSDVLPRSRLTSRLGASPDVRLTLVSAPAGFGKTTVLSAWSSRSAEARDATAWVSLDARDSDPTTFWAYVGAALRTVAPELAVPAHDPAGGGLEQLVNDLHGLERDVDLVLDDYHVIDSPVVHEGLAFLVDHLPPRLHVVLATRADPPLPLARLRARGQLAEVRASDLRFTADEAAAYLRDAMRLPLTERDLAVLDERTEGWVAALQLAALSMQGRDDLPDFIAGFTGDDRYIVDYLAEEVLQRLAPELRGFLLQTSLLSRFTGPLCDAVTAQPGGKAKLAALERQNLFVVALDDQRRWYRYHHLFADVLRTRLLDEHPELVAELHLRASRWHDAHGDADDAVHHAVEGRHWELAAQLVERSVPELRRQRREATLRRWIEQLPAEVVRERPVLGISYAGSLMSLGVLEGVEPHLHDVERWLEGADPASLQGDPLLRTLPGTVAMYRAGLARLRGDVEGTLTHAHRVLALAGEHDHLERGAAAALLGLAHWTTGDVESARQRYVESAECMLRAGHVADLLGCTVALADLELARGRPREALAAYRRALDAAQREPVLPRGTADVHTGIGTLLLERDEVDAALEHLRTSADLGEAAALPQNAYRWRLAMAAARQVEGDLAGALALLDEAELVYDTDYLPDVRPVAAVRARLQLAHGRVADARSWARTRGLSTRDDLTYLKEYEHLTLARVLLHEQEGAGRTVPELEPFLDRLLAAAEQGGRTGSRIDVLLLQARAAHAVRDTGRALQRLQGALDLVGSQDHVRTFLDHGPAVVELLRPLARSAPPGSHVLRLLAAPGSRTGQVPAQHPGPDQLSEREIEVLRLLTSDLDGPGIARTLVLSVNTVRTHTKSIYAKLGVNSRREAVRRAQDLGLLGRGARPTSAHEVHPPAHQAW